MTKIQDILFFRLFKPFGLPITKILFVLGLIIIATFVFLLDRELARLADLFFGAAARVLGLGLGAQVGVG